MFLLCCILIQGGASESSAKAEGRVQRGGSFCFCLFSCMLKRKKQPKQRPSPRTGQCFIDVCGMQHSNRHRRQRKLGQSRGDPEQRPGKEINQYVSSGFSMHAYKQTEPLMQTHAICEAEAMLFRMQPKIKGPKSEANSACMHSCPHARLHACTFM